MKTAAAHVSQLGPLQLLILKVLWDLEEAIQAEEEAKAGENDTYVARPARRPGMGTTSQAISHAVRALRPSTKDSAVRVLLVRMAHYGLLVETKPELPEYVQKALRKLERGSDMVLQKVVDDAPRWLFQTHYLPAFTRAEAFAHQLSHCLPVMLQLCPSKTGLEGDTFIAMIKHLCLHNPTAEAKKLAGIMEGYFGANRSSNSRGRIPSSVGGPHREG